MTSRLTHCTRRHIFWILAYVLTIAGCSTVQEVAKQPSQAPDANASSVVQDVTTTQSRQSEPPRLPLPVIETEPNRPQSPPTVNAPPTTDYRPLTPDVPPAANPPTLPTAYRPPTIDVPPTTSPLPPTTDYRPPIANALPPIANALTVADAPQPTDLSGPTIQQMPLPKKPQPSQLPRVSPLTTVANGEDTIDLTLPDKMDLVELLDLTTRYLGLEYICDPEKIRGQVVSLKLHGKLQGKVRIKDLYSLLQTILKFKGLAMARQSDNLVAIVPMAEAMDVDPRIVEPNGAALQAGDLVVTRVFELQYADVAAVTALLKDLKQGIAVTPIEDTQTLLVTCFTHRLERIEQLVGMIDRPGRPKVFRFRTLKFTTARTMAEKVRTLTEQLQSIPVVVADAPPPPGKSSIAKPRSGKPGQGQAVYLDTDERTNRVLMIGYEDQLVLVDELIDSLDVAQQDLRAMMVYPINHVDASDALKKIETLKVVGKRSSYKGSGPPSAASGPSTAGSADGVLVEEPDVVILEQTNSLLINATPEQHVQVRTILGLIDVVPEDLRTLEVYPIQYVEAVQILEKLQDLNVLGKTSSRSTRRQTKISMSGPPPGQGPAAPTMDVMGPTSSAGGIMTDEAQVVVLEQSNSLLVNATQNQHIRIRTIIDLVDVQTPQEAIPFEIYFLESQSPKQLSEILNKVIQETITNADGKTQKTVSRTEDQIVIVPDDLTFSLIVYANRKNQEWIGNLVKKLDRRRPQVLIDVTLVEIRKTDEFNYDLTLVGSTPESVQIPALSGDATVTTERPLLRLQSTSGNLAAFYADTHISALLSAMQRKNYGRVLAKPKVLVNDNEKGTIKTTETTYVTKKSSIPVTGGTGGTQNTLIETAVDYQGYDAGVSLDITPHIGEGDLLRLDIITSRSDFGTISGDKPPDRTSNELNTVVTVPDESTIILGGMLKLNQTKGGKKVPILGDLPLLGALFRGVSNTGVESKLYIFVRAQIIRPAQVQGPALEDLKRISDQNREAFEMQEAEFQRYQNTPGVKPKKTEPSQVLQTQ